MKVLSKKGSKFKSGDLVRIPHLPRKNDSSALWQPDPAGAHVGIVIREDVKNTRDKWDALIGQLLVIEISTGEVVTLSSTLVEPLDKVE